MPLQIGQSRSVGHRVKGSLALERIAVRALQRELTEQHGPMDSQYDAALDLLRRVDPKNVTENLNVLCKQNPDLAEELLSTVDQPLTLRQCPTTKKMFLCCDYNRDGDSFRSPYTNEYVPPIDDAAELPVGLRKLEETANDAFDTYRELYYEGGHSSCYLWEQEDEGFAGVVLFQKEQSQSRWDSVHVFEVLEPTKTAATYRLTSTVMLDIGSKSTVMSGNLTRQAERKMRIEEAADHIANVGTLVEDMESKLRSLLHEVYFGKTRDIVGDMRSVENLEDVRADEKRKRAVVTDFEDR